MSRSALVAGLMLAAFASAADAQATRLVRFAPRGLPPSDVYWVRARGVMQDAELSNKEFRLRLPANARHNILVVYNLGESKYVPAQLEVRMTVRADQDHLITLALRPWKSCSKLAYENLREYSTITQPSLIRAILEAQFLLNYRNGAACNELSGEVKRILSDRRLRLAQSADHLSFQ